MRVTDQMMFDQANRSNGLARSRVERDIAQTSSGLRVTHPGDDPAAAGLLVQSRFLQERFTAIAQAAETASSDLTVADAAAGAIGNELIRAHEIAMQLVNPTYSAEQRVTAAAEVDQIYTAVLAQLNTEAGDRYLFGGNRDDSAPFDATGTYLGDTAVRKVEIAPGVYAPAAVRADAAVKGIDPFTGAVTGVDVMTTLHGLSTALRANDVAGIRSTLDSLFLGISQVSELRGQIGSAQSSMDTAAATNKAAQGDEKLRGAGLGDIDIIEATTSLAQAQQALEASLAASAQGLRFTLLDYLK
jgi:flagellar hook-associated protein 3 FlgL